MFNSQNGSRTTLTDLAEDFELNDDNKISKQALDARFNAEAVNFLKAVLSNMQAASLEEVISKNPKTSFDSCKLRDSTRFGLPDQYADKYKGHGGGVKTKSMISIQYELDLLSGQPVDLQLTSARRNDQRDSKESCSAITPNSLLIRDLGYITSTYLKSVIDQKAYFLNRLPSQMNVYKAADGEQVDFKKLDKKMKRHNLPFIELAVLIGKKAQIPCRLVVYLADQKVARHRLKKTTKNTKSIGCKVSEKQKIRSKLNIYITNTDKETIKPEHIAQLYSLRWQIELIFKTWKSLCNIDKTKAVKLHRFECTLLAGLIWILANWNVFRYINKWFEESIKNKTPSIWKFFKHVSKHKIALRKILFEDDDLESWIQQITQMAESKFYRETKKGKLSYSEAITFLA